MRWRKVKCVLERKRKHAGKTLNFSCWAAELLNWWVELFAQLTRNLDSVIASLCRVCICMCVCMRVCGIPHWTAAPLTLPPLGCLPRCASVCYFHLFCTIFMAISVTKLNALLIRLNVNGAAATLAQINTYRRAPHSAARSPSFTCFKSISARLIVFVSFCFFSW